MNARDDTPSDPFSDREVRAFIDRAPRSWTYSELAAACLERFGPGRAWPRSKIARYWQATHAGRRGHPSRLDLDDELRDFVEDRLGRLTLDDVRAACVERFGAGRAPSRSALCRYSLRVRARSG